MTAAAASAEEAEAEKKRAANRKKRDRAKAKKHAQRQGEAGDKENEAPGAGSTPEPAGENSAEPTVEAAAVSDEEAAKRREANRKKKERAKAKKKANAAAAAGGGCSPLTVNAERRDAGPDRGMGMFALDDIAEGEVVARARPALSVVFDTAAKHLCSYCFRPATGPPCSSCSRFATCADCAPLASWHSHECAEFMGLPPDARRGGDTSMLRMLLRYKVTAAHGEWCGDGDSTVACTAEGKEPLALLDTLQAIDTTGGRAPVRLHAVTM